MSTTLARPLVKARDNVPGLRLDPPGHRRRPALAVGSLALVVACVAVFVSVYLRAGNERSVLALARAVPQGEVLRAADLTVARVSTTSAIATVSASESSIVIGRRAAVPLLPNTLLSANELMTSYSPPAGESVVGVAAKEGQLPASGVMPGESVDVVLTGLPGAPESASVVTNPAADQQTAGGTTGASVAVSLPGTVLVADAKVLEVVQSPSPSGSSGVVVSLVTSTAAAPLVASAAAAGQVALIVVPPKS